MNQYFYQKYSKFKLLKMIFHLFINRSFVKDILKFCYPTTLIDSEEGRNGEVVWMKGYLGMMKGRGDSAKNIGGRRAWGIC